ncbi:WD40 repeats containg secreted protein [Pseudoalteromonas luteoviolacea B = ATCC 29581]|nr:WD40 repeats containg secreted protein [Pseudoalteromonas luteoviolacea B = ATCC 29581]
MQKRLIWFVCWLTLLAGCSEPLEKPNEDSFALVNEPVAMAKFSKDSQLLALYTLSKELQVWAVDTRSVKLVLPFSKLGEVARDITLTSDNQHVLVASENRISFWALDTGNLSQFYSINGADPLARIATLASAPNNDFLAIGMTDGSVVLMSFKDKSQRLFKPHDAEVAHLRWDSRSEKVLSGGFDGHVALWRFSDAHVEHEFNVAKRVTSLATDSSLSKAFVSDAVHDQIVWDFKQNKALSRLSYPERFRWFRASFLFDERSILVTASSKSKLFVWDINSGNELASWWISASNSEALILDIVQVSSGTLMTISSDGIVERWPLDSMLSK